MNAHGHASVGKTLYFGALKASLNYTGATKGNARLKAQALPSKLLTVNDRVTAVVAHTGEQIIKVCQEGISGDAIGQGNAQAAAVDLIPHFQSFFL